MNQRQEQLSVANLAAHVPALSDLQARGQSLTQHTNL